MNPVLTYSDFLNYLRRYSNDEKRRYIPVLLIKPDTILYLNGEHRLDYIFNYFDRRTGSRVDFFLPGYSHYPNLSFPESMSYRPFDENVVALSLRRIGDIFYSDNAFVDFIELVEESCYQFRYYGDTELVFFLYDPGADESRGSFDFSLFHRYNLSKLFLSDNERLYSVRHFLEEVIHEIIETPNDERLINKINRYYHG